MYLDIEVELYDYRDFQYRAQIQKEMTSEARMNPASPNTMWPPPNCHSHDHIWGPSPATAQGTPHNAWNHRDVPTTKVPPMRPYPLLQKYSVRSYIMLDWLLLCLPPLLHWHNKKKKYTLYEKLDHYLFFHLHVRKWPQKPPIFCLPCGNLLVSFTAFCKGLSGKKCER